MKRTYPMFDEATSSDLAKRLLAHLSNGTTDQMPSPVTVDPTLFCDEAIAQREREALFDRLPLIAAHVTQLPNPHDFVTVSLPGNEVLLVRQPDGSVAGFVNACRHRGTQLVDAPRGTTRRFVCPYHGWSYDADGALHSVTHAETFGPIDRASSGLVRLPVEERHGFVWIVQRPDADIDVAAWLGPEMDAVLQSYRLDTYHYADTLVYCEPMNWKLLAHGAIDSYHLRFLHPRTVGKFIHTNVQVVDPMDRHVRFITPRKTFDTFDQQPLGTPLDSFVIAAHLLMPNTNLIGQPSHFEAWTFWPAGPDPSRGSLEIKVLLPQPVLDEDDTSFLAKNIAIARDALENEDLPIGRRIQATVGGRNARPLTLGRNETANQLFHQFLATQV